MTPEQMQLLRDTAASDKGNVICIAILNLFQLVEDKNAKLDAILDLTKDWPEAEWIASIVNHGRHVP